MRPGGNTDVSYFSSVGTFIFAIFLPDTLIAELGAKVLAVMTLLTPLMLRLVDLMFMLSTFLMVLSRFTIG